MVLTDMTWISVYVPDDQGLILQETIRADSLSWFGLDYLTGGPSAEGTKE